MAKSLERLRADTETFSADVNTFCDQICGVCTKRCYPNQVELCHSSAEAFPDELKRSEPLVARNTLPARK